MTWEDEQLQIAAEATHETSIDIDSIKHVGGLDITWDPKSEGYIAALSVLTYPEMKLVDTVYLVKKVAEDAPEYRSGYLAFREFPVYHELLALARARGVPAPDVYLVDGNGQYHIREAGVATHVGVLEGLATIGVAKKAYIADNINRADVEASNAIPTVGGESNVRSTSGAVIATALRSGESRYPLYVSSGHMVGLEDAGRVVRTCCLHRIPEPIRQADKGSRQMLRELGPGLGGGDLP